MAQEERPASRPPTPTQRPQGQGQQQSRPQGDRGPRPQGDQRRFEQRPKRSPEDRNTIFIGNKPPMNYVLAVVTQFNGGSNEVIIKARGQAISHAVDVAEIVRNKFFQKAVVKNVTIGTESVMSDDGRKRAVSAIEIRLANSEAAPMPASGKTAVPEATKPAGSAVEPGPQAKSGGV